MEMKHAFLFERQLDHLVVVARYGDHGRASLDLDIRGVGRQLQRIRQRGQTSSDLIIGLVRRESRLLTHRVLELVVLEVRLSEIDAEIDPDDDDQQGEQTAEPALPAPVYHWDCAPSIIW